MTQEEKTLLIKDLCARLPYGVQVQDTRCGISGKLHDMLVFPLYKGNDVYDYIATTNFYTDCYCDDIVLFKPYLLPLSSMNEEQIEEYCQLQQKVIYNSKGVVNEDVTKYVNWCYKNHLDINNLIPKGLAIDATGLNIY